MKIVFPGSFVWRVDMTLTAENCEILKECIHLARVQQSDLAQELAISPSWLSQILNGKRVLDRPGVADRLVELVAASLKRVTLADEIGRSLGQSRLAALEEMRAALTGGDAACPKACFAEPGDTVLEQAANFVRTPPIEIAVRRFEEKPCIITVAGPVLSGKTTVLNCLRQRAVLLGIKDTQFSCRDIEINRDKKKGGGFHEVASHFIASLEQSLGLSRRSLGGEITPTSLALWIAKNLRGVGVRFALFIDSFESLDPSVQASFLRFCRGLQIESSVYNIQFWLVVACSPATMDLVALSVDEPDKVSPFSILSGTDLPWSWFDKETAFSTLLASYGYEDESTLAQLYHCTSGQPFLTHCWLHSNPIYGQGLSPAQYFSKLQDTRLIKFQTRIRTSFHEANQIHDEWHDADLKSLFLRNLTGGRNICPAIAGMSVLMSENVRSRLDELRHDTGLEDTSS